MKTVHRTLGILAILAAGLLLNSLPAQSQESAPNVAVVNSTHPLSYDWELEDDVVSLGWKLEKFQNTSAADLMKRLDQLQIVIIASKGNFNNPQYMLAYKDRWLEFLNRGGVLIVTDASYSSVLDRWLGVLGEDFQLQSREVKPRRADKIVFSTSPLANYPNKLSDKLTSKAYFTRNSLVKWPECWQSLITRNDNQSILLCRQVGKGMVVATTYSGFGWGTIIKPFFENVWMYLTFKNAGLCVDNYQCNNLSVGENNIKLVLGGESSAKRAVNICADVIGNGEVSECSDSASKQIASGEPAGFDLHLNIANPGTKRLILTATDSQGAQICKWTSSVNVAKKPGKMLAKRNDFTSGEPAVQVRRDGVTLVHGKPFFPIGLYHVSWGSTAQERLADARDVAAAGFNVIHVGTVPGEFDAGTYGEFLDACQDMKLKVITESLQSMKDLAGKFKNHPAVLAWDASDEPSAHGVTPEAVKAVYDSVKQADPDHPVYISQAGLGTEYNCATDIIAPDPYPIGPDSCDTIDSVYKGVSSPMAVRDTYGNAVWGVLQGIGYLIWRDPTYKESRAMTYLALLAGAKGLMWYAYRDPFWDIADHPQLWNSLKDKIVPEIKKLSPAVMDGQFKLLTKGTDGVYAGKWIYGKSTYLAVVNTWDEPRNFGFKVDGKNAQTWPGSDTKAKLAGGIIKGTINGGDTMLIEISK